MYSKHPNIAEFEDSSEELYESSIALDEFANAYGTVFHEVAAINSDGDEYREDDRNELQNLVKILDKMDIDNLFARIKKGIEKARTLSNYPADREEYRDPDEDE